MKEILDTVERWQERGERVAIATVVATRKSAPRPLGSKLAVSTNGEMAGSVSGGCVENEVFVHACNVLAGAEPRLLHYGIADELALSVGLPCGGEIDVFVSAPDESLLERLKRVVSSGERAVLFTVVAGDGLGSQLIVTEDGEQAGQGPKEAVAYFEEVLSRGRNRLLTFEGGERVFAEVYGSAPRLLVYGTVDTAEALCRLAKALGWQAIVADARAKFATAERLPSADEVLVSWPDEALAKARPDSQTAVLVLSHDEKFDVPAIKAALKTEAFYVGALGSRHNQERRRERLLEAGVGADELARVHGPCGLDIGADTPAETALSIMAEILAVRDYRSGGSLRDSSGPIHASGGRDVPLARD